MLRCDGGFEAFGHEGDAGAGEGFDFAAEDGVDAAVGAFEGEVAGGFAGDEAGEGAAVVGFDDIAPSAYVEPPLTTVRVPLYELGVRGLRLALDLLNGKDRPKPYELPLQLVVRSTTATPRHVRSDTP